jgi:putative transferase (TIGR04331 family)
LKLLVTSGLEETWSLHDYKLVFLGRWCVPYRKLNKLKESEYEIIPFHWDNREKLAIDYEYLSKLHSILLAELVEFLNDYHKTNYSLKFWQNILDPWLLNYLSVLFDRWENLNTLFKQNEESFHKIIITDNKIKIPFDYNDFVEYSTSDNWNEFLFNKIIEFQFNKRISYIKVINKVKKLSNIDFKYKIKKLSLINFRYYLLRILFHNTELVLVETSIRGGFISRFRLQCSLRKIIIFSVPELNPSITGTFKNRFIENLLGFRNLGELKLFNANSDFEIFIKQNILGDLPVSLLEAFNTLSEYVGKISLKPKLIITAGAHWGNTLAKFWFAFEQESGTKLIVSEHGGSFPAFKELLNFEEDISYLKATWFLPFHPKHVKLPPLKLIGLYNKWKSSNNEICSIIGNETPKYVFRIHFYALSSQFLYSFSEIQLFYENLDSKIQLKTLFRPYYDCGWDTSEMLNEYFKNKNLIFREESYESLLNRSKIVICSYPETTFSEAMAIGVPTILLYNPKFNERNEVTEQVINLLLDAKIIFNNPLDASSHLNLIWDNVGDWWNSTKVIYARNVFLEQATYPHKDWNVIWAKFLNKVLKFRS